MDVAEVRPSSRSLFETKLTLYTREFKGQSSGPHVDTFTIQSNSIDEFKEKLLEKVKPLIKCEVILVEEEYQWAPEADIDAKNLGKFVQFSTKTARKVIEYDSISDKHLAGWKDVDLCVYVHIYSLSVNSQTTYKKLKKSLIDPAVADRAGASAFVEVQDLVAKLKETHRNNFQGSAIAWTIWANQILGSEGHAREQLMQGPPPANIIRLFTRAQDASSANLCAVRSNVSIGASVSQGLARHFEGMCTLADKMTLMAKDFTLLAQEFNERVKLANTVAATNVETLTAVATAVEETSFSNEVFDAIANVEDVDHL